MGKDTEMVKGPVEQEVKEKLTALQLEKLRELQKNKTSVTNEFAAIGAAEYEIKKRKDFLEKFFDKHREDERALLSELKELYGDINVDLETGEFTRPN